MERVTRLPPSTAEEAVSIWTTRGPNVWPLPPATMSYTTLRDIETCPRRWGLRRGEYAGLWSRKGYPPAAMGAAIAGQVVHVAIERIVDAVAATGAGHGSRNEDAASNPMLLVIEALRSLGGITVLLEDVIRGIVTAWEPNPRIRPRAEDLANELRRQVPILRPRVQHFLNQTDLTRVRSPQPLSTVPESRIATEGGDRPLAAGLYAEVALFHDDLRWFGKADLLRVPAEGADDAEIIDFKTGAPKPDHELQLRSYALLWARESRLNPKARPVRRLTILYESGPVSVPPPASERDLEEIENDLRTRTLNAKAAVDRHPPEPRPTREACEWCDVRHLCPAYWAPATRAFVAPADATNLHLIDATVRVTGKQGAWSWMVSLEAVGALTAGVSVGDRMLVRARPHDTHFTTLLALGGTFRILSAQFVAASDESGGFPVLSLTRASEAFMVTESGAVE